MELVPFEIAKKLKEKGFDEECLAYYTSEYTLYLNKVVLCDDKYLDMAEIDYEECLRSYNTQKDRYLRTLVDAPTISQVLKWLREEKKIFILIDIRTDLSWIYEIWGIEISLSPLGTAPYQKNQSYEQAALAAIEYVLDKLI